MFYHAHERYLSTLTDDYRRNSLMELKAKKIDSGDLEMSPPTLSYHLSKPKKADFTYETTYKISFL